MAKIRAVHSRKHRGNPTEKREVCKQAAVEQKTKKYGKNLRAFCKNRFTEHVKTKKAFFVCSVWKNTENFVKKGKTVNLQI
ncbi:MAG: hypothetical protein IJE63_01315, partial [Clostridia bacterium]|nr:hypothetical protein [Clostridia bacterium]